MHVVQKRYDESAPDVHVPSAVGIGGDVEPEMAPNVARFAFGEASVMQPLTPVMVTMNMEQCSIAPPLNV
jgi:hypothetical protein